MNMRGTGDRMTASLASINVRLRLSFPIKDRQILLKNACGI